MTRDRLDALLGTWETRLDDPELVSEIVRRALKTRGPFKQIVFPEEGEEV